MTVNSNNDDAMGTRVRDYAGEFDTYVRVFNPAYWTATGHRVGWSMFTESRASLVSNTQWVDLVRVRRHDIDEPMMGSLDPSIADVLAEILARHTRMPVSCDFAFWTGYADTLVPTDAPHVVGPPERTLFVVTAPVRSGARLPSSPRRALRWWPHDDSWRVGNDIYARSVFVGGRHDTIDTILADPRLESIVVSPDDPVGPEDL